MQLDGVFFRPGAAWPRRSAAAAGMVGWGAMCGVLKGWEAVGGELLVAAGGLVGEVVEGGGVLGAALSVEGTMAAVAIVRCGGIRE
jgi:hypothetical protein